MALAAHPWRPVADVEIARLRADMLDAVQHFFRTRDILPVDTPYLADTAVSDPNIESVQAHLSTRPPRQVYLHTSPEYAMKRLLAAGFPDIGQVCRVFRDGEAGRNHQPEFTMIEWYRLRADLNAIIADTLDLLNELLGGRDASVTVRRTYAEAFLQHARIDPFHASVNELALCNEADESLREALGTDRDAWLDLTLSQRVSPGFDPHALTVVTHYPASQAALARLCPDDQRVADRFEVFYGQLELANGYVELTDAAEQTARFADDQRVRRERDAVQRPLDSALLQALENGLPACAGVAVGLDRLLMIRSGNDDIRAVQHFPHGMEP